MKVLSVAVWSVWAALVTAAAACDPQTAATRSAAPSSVEPTASDLASSTPSVTAAPSASAKVAPAPAKDVPLLDFSTLAKDAPKLSGKRVRVIGEIFAGGFTLTTDRDGVLTLSTPGGTCTGDLCAKGFTCCDHCASDVSLMTIPLMGVRLVDKADPHRFMCTGSECSMTCNPPKGGRYEAIGIFRFGPQGELDLEVESIAPLP